RAVAAPIVVNLGEYDARAVAGPHRLPDPYRGHGLDVLPGREVANAQMEALGAGSIGQRCREASVRADFQRAEAEVILPVGLGRLVENDLIVPTGNGLPIPGPVLRAGRERPPIEIVAVADRNRAVVFLDPPLHLLEQLVEE